MTPNLDPEPQKESELLDPTIRYWHTSKNHQLIPIAALSTLFIIPSKYLKHGGGFRARFAPFQPNSSRSNVARGARRKVPTPEPHTEMPVASARRLSK